MTQNLSMLVPVKMLDHTIRVYVKCYKSFEKSHVTFALPSNDEYEG